MSWPALEKVSMQVAAEYACRIQRCSYDQRDIILQEAIDVLEERFNKLSSAEKGTDHVFTEQPSMLAFEISNKFRDQQPAKITPERRQDLIKQAADKLREAIKQKRLG